MTKQEMLRNLADVYELYKDRASMISDVISFIKENTIEPKHGKWLDAREDDSCWFICSECKTMVDADYNYCPHCGADMRGDEQ